MLKKKKRLNRAVFSNVSQGKPLHFPAFSVRYLVHKGQIEGRFSVVVSKKVSKTAAGRNQLRRVVYEAIKKVDPKYVSAIIFLKKEATTISRVKLSLEIQSAVRSVVVR